MWWNGIPPRLRGAVWSRAIGNDLEVSDATYTIALAKATKTGERHDELVASTQHVFAEQKIFAPGQPLHQDLVDVCLAYSSYRPDISPPAQSSIVHIAALLLLQLGAQETFILLSNLLNRPLPLSFLIQDHNAMHAAYSSTISALSKKFPQMAARLETLRAEPRTYLADMFTSLFCNRLGVEHAARVVDIYVIEGDKIPPRVAVAIMGILEGACTEGSADDVACVLRERSIGVDVEGFVGRVYEAGKSG